jgi:CheY-like chemotaxis protein
MSSPEAGWTLLELLTLDRETRNIPVIVCSAAVRDLHAHEDMLKQFGIAILPKPFDIARLYMEVEEALATRKGTSLRD